ncbi:copper resistance protein CopC [Streptomyces sp. ME08-AFT2]|uniref:copper resistance CopC/CopD family protein n=1 Tax=Streptomyces sp. ME08-AFT2 TaxID=3028683 RepID=UPI0029A45C62|nr:copper resistance protein CopC [Streptomyces sp. ME08-AFT2]MDX3308201.1 copper resistance protein CopC [Streptomyces sp. ME08-AFT2]
MTSSVPTVRRSVVTIGSFVSLVLVLLLGTAAPASAHATLLFTSPAADATVADSPKSLVLVFDQPVSLSGTSVRVEPSARLGTATLSQGNQAVTVPVRSTLAEGVRTINWQVTARDGDVMTGSYRFAVGPRTIALASGQTTAAKDATPTTILRWLLFAALAVMLGEAAGRRLTARVPDTPTRRPRSWALPASLIGATAALILAALQLGDGSFSSLTGTRPGVLSLVEVAGFALVAVAVLVRRRTWAVVPLTAVLVAEALRAHPQAEQAVAGPVLTFVHLTAAVLWTGTLLHVLHTLAAWRGERSPVRALLFSYARLAAWLFAAVAVTGLISALLLVPLRDLATTTYGQVLLVKIALVTVVGGLALAARRRLRRTGAGSPQRPARAETGVLAVVLAFSATLTVLSVPADANRSLPFAPPLDGPVVPAGTRAGEIGISARAATGRLVIDLTAPQIGGNEKQSYGLKATLADPRGTRRALKLRGCGTGCFYTPVTWRMGTSRLTLTASAGEEWAGGRAGLAVTWPPRPDTVLLRETVAAMKKTPRFTLHELVTSNTARGLGDLRQLPITGTEFLASEPYGSGTAPVITRLADENGHRRLALAYPAEHTQLDLTLDETGRILHETLTAPNHLVTRTFVYPETDEDGHDH